MPTLSVNGELKQLADLPTIEQLLELLGYETVRIAVAVNGDFVPRSQYSQTVTNDGDKIDVVQAIGGG